jgi:hypothetical protein
MGFSDDFAACMSPLPVPSLEGAAQVAEFLEQVHNAWESAGGETEMLVAALVAAGAVTGIDEAALAAAGEATVTAYLAACAACLARVLASDIWSLVASSDTSAWLQQDLTQAANDNNIPRPEATA